MVILDTFAMVDAAPHTDLPDLLLATHHHVSLHFDQAQRLLTPASGHDVGVLLHQLIPEFNALQVIVAALQRDELQTYTQEPIMRTSAAGVARIYRVRLQLTRPGAQVESAFTLEVEEITEVYALRAQVQQLQEQVQQYRAMVDMIAHDLNTPLTTLQGYLELTSVEMQDVGNESFFEHLQIMQGCVERIMFTVGEMYDVVAMDAGQLRLHSRTVAPLSLLRRAIQETGVIVERRQQTLRLEAPDDLPALRCDDLRVLQILQNLISNASKYSPHHTPITVRAALEPDRSHVCITVIDRGRGIEAAQLPFVFERAFRVHETEHQIKGAGLGLYLARLLVEMHGGRIWCESEVGQGSSFHFTLPVADRLRDY